MLAVLREESGLIPLKVLRISQSLFRELYLELRGYCSDLFFAIGLADAWSFQALLTFGGFGGLNAFQTHSSGTTRGVK